jgi:hypothetical protein
MAAMLLTALWAAETLAAFHRQRVESAVGEAGFITRAWLPTASKA